MKYAILLAVLLAPGAVMAQSEVCSSSLTVNTVTIASHTATLVDSAALTLPNRKWAEVQNVSTDTVRCASAPESATTTTGRLITANGGAWELPVAGGAYVDTLATTSPFVSRSYVQSIKLYCITTATNVTGKVVLSQCK
jgi:hypothetical protein